MTTSKFEEAIGEIRNAVAMLERSTSEVDRFYWSDTINQWMWHAMVAIHDEFPNEYNHPGEYRPLQREGQA